MCLFNTEMLFLTQDFHCQIVLILNFGYFYAFSHSSVHNAELLLCEYIYFFPSTSVGELL